MGEAKRDVFADWAVKECVFTEGDLAYGTSEVKNGRKIWDAATAFASQGGEELERKVAMLLEALKTTREELRACQAAIHCSGDFDPRYVQDAQAAMKMADEAIAATQITAEAYDHKMELHGGRKALLVAANKCDSQFEKNKPMQDAGGQGPDYQSGYANGCGDCGHEIRRMIEEYSKMAMAKPIYFPLPIRQYPSERSAVVVFESEGDRDIFLSWMLAHVIIGLTEGKR